MTVACAVEVFPESGDALVMEAAKVLQTYSGDLVSQIVELDSWLNEPGVNEAQCGDWLTLNGYLYQEVSELLTMAKRYQAGRRPTKRPFTIAALEERRLNGSRSWRKLVQNFCDCTKTEHDDCCREALRKSAAQLESTLKKYRELPVPADVVAPLANMFLDRLGWQHSS